MTGAANHNYTRFFGGMLVGCRGCGRCSGRSSCEGRHQQVGGCQVVPTLDNMCEEKDVFLLRLLVVRK